MEVLHGENKKSKGIPPIIYSHKAITYRAALCLSQLYAAPRSNSITKTDRIVRIWILLHIHIIRPSEYMCA